MVEVKEFIEDYLRSSISAETLITNLKALEKPINKKTKESIYIVFADHRMSINELERTLKLPSTHPNKLYTINSLKKIDELRINIS